MRRALSIVRGDDSVERRKGPDEKLYRTHITFGLPEYRDIKGSSPEFVYKEVCRQLLKFLERARKRWPGKLDEEYLNKISRELVIIAPDGRRISIPLRLPAVRSRSLM